MRARVSKPPRAPKVPRLLRESVYQQVKQWILTGELHPGQFLGEAQIAESLDVSRTPVREALASLQRDGLVELVPHRGALIRWPSPKDVEELFDIRIAVERLALEKAFPRLNAEALRILAVRLETQEGKLDTISYQAIEQLSVDVHMTILEAAGNRRIVALIHQLREQVYIASTLYQNADGTVNLPRVRQVTADHRELVAALLKRSVAVATKALEAHLGRTREMVLEAMRQGGRAGGAREEGRSG